MTTELYDYDKNRQAHDLIRKLMEDGMTEDQALKTWQNEQGICPVIGCGADRQAYLKTLGEPCWHGHGEKLN